MKRSRSIRLVLMGGLSATALTSGGPTGAAGDVLSSAAVYTNNHYVPGVGYYHAPYRGWYALPYNHYDPQTQRYFHGGQWAAGPHLTITNLSEPTPEAVSRAAAQRTDVRRGGFGSTSRGGHYFHS